MSKRILITGAAGFIGFHLAYRLLEEGHTVVGFDDLNDYYDVELKSNRLKILERGPKFKFVRGDITSHSLAAVVRHGNFDVIYHLAAIAGVRYSLENPLIYIDTNETGTLNLFEAVRALDRKPQILAASSAAVYGTSQVCPSREDELADRPSALYGATKRSNELMAATYSHLFGMKITMLRFFTAYGPYGRPDMALWIFTDRILRGLPIELNNGGNMTRDFTYVSDIVDGIRLLTEAPGGPLYDVFNIGGGQSRTLREFVALIEKAAGKTAIIQEMPFPAGDVKDSMADLAKIKAHCGYSPKVPPEIGVPIFVSWYQAYLEQCREARHQKA